MQAAEWRTYRHGIEKTDSIIYVLSAMKPPKRTTEYINTWIKFWSYKNKKIKLCKGRLVLRRFHANRKNLISPYCATKQNT